MKLFLAMWMLAVPQAQDLQIQDAAQIQAPVTQHEVASELEVVSVTPQEEEEVCIEHQCESEQE